MNILKTKNYKNYLRNSFRQEQLSDTAMLNIEAKEAKLMTVLLKLNFYIENFANLKA